MLCVCVSICTLVRNTRDCNPGKSDFILKTKIKPGTGRVLTYNQSPSNAQEDDYSLLQRKEALGEIESANTLISDFHPLCGMFSKPSIL